MDAYEKYLKDFKPDVIEINGKKYETVPMSRSDHEWMQEVFGNE